MRRTRLFPNASDFPEPFRPLIENNPVYASSCSKAAQVWLLDGGGGLYLKSAAAGSLKTEADMTRYFHSLSLGAEVLAYLSEERDWMLTKRIPGEDCVFPDYLAQPRRLCDTLASLLRQLHETPFSGCPVTDRCAAYRAAAERNHLAGQYDAALFPDGWGFSSAEEAWHLIQTNGKYLKSDTLLHGDYCLPNIILDRWKFSGFVDLDSSGVGDRHIDLFWGVWTLFFNLKTNAYYDRFLDAYGRDRVEPELLRTVAAFETFL